MTVTRVDLYWYMIYGDDVLIHPWRFISGNSSARDNNTWTIRAIPNVAPGEVAFVDMGLNTSTALARDQDRLTLDREGSFKLNIRGVEHIDATANTDVTLNVVGRDGFTTDGSIRAIEVNVGHHELTYTGATRDSTLFTGVGWDKVHLTDNPDVANTQYWSVVRRPDGEVDAYNLHSGYRIRMEDGGSTWGNTNGRLNYGEVDEINLASRIRGTDQHLLGKVVSNTGDRGSFDNIDLSITGTQDYSDRLNSASFKSINYATTNVHKGTAVIESFTGDTTVGVQATIKDHITNNGVHYLIVEQQTNALNGHLRLYVRDNDSELYNRFNEVLLGSGGVDNYTNTYSTTSRNAYATNVVTGAGATAVLGTAMYGFDGNDILVGGADADYLFGGTSTYSTIVTTNNTGNQLTGGDGDDYFGVGNISAGADGDAIMTTNFTARLSGTAPLSSSVLGKLARIDADDSADLATRVATDRITDWTAGVDYLRVLANGTAIVEGLGTANGAGGTYGADEIDTTGVIAEKIDLSGGRVNNEGKIVTRGFGGNDTLIGSTGDDWLYGNAASNFYTISQGGNDRVYIDQFDGSRAKHFVSGFTTSTGAANDTDLIMLNKRIIDAFYGAGDGRSAVKGDITAGVYLPGTTYNPGSNYLHDVFYNPSFTATNTQHNSDDGAAFWQGTTGADGKSSLSGLGMAIAGRAMFAIPFVGPFIGAALIGASVPIYGLGFKPNESQAHQNATYNKFVGNYVNVISRSEIGNSVISSTTTPNTNIKFLDFFPGSTTSDGYLPVVEFTAHANGPIYGYFALHSNVETFVYLVASPDNMVENGEAILVAEIDGLLTAADFGVYDGQDDIYNYGVLPDVIIRTPVLDIIADTAATPDQGQTDGLIVAAVNPIEIVGRLTGAMTGGSYFRVYDGGEKIYDGLSAVSGQAVSLALNANNINFTFTDNRPLGTTVRNSTNNTPTSGNTTGDDTFVLADARVIYTVELIDGETGIPTRVSSIVIEISGGNGIIDGGDGIDTLLLTKTSAYVNSFANNSVTADGRLLGMEKIVLTPEPVILSSVTRDDAGVITAIAFSGVKATGVADGVYDLTIINDTTNTTTGVSTPIGSGAIATATVTGGVITAVNIVNGGSDYDADTVVALDGSGIELILTHQTEDFEVFGSTAADRIVGGSGDDQLFGVGGADTLIGGIGDDTIDGGIGADSIDGGVGNDVFIYASAAALGGDTTVIGNDGIDTIRMDTTSNPLALESSDFSKVNTVEILALNGTSTQAVTLGSHTNAAFATGITLTTRAEATSLNLQGALSSVTIHATGTDNADTMVGGAGDDTLIGGAGNDLIEGRAGGDSLVGGSGSDTFVYSDAAHLLGDTINGGVGDVDVIRLDAGGTYNLANQTVTNIEQIAVNVDAQIALTLAIHTNGINANVEVLNTTGAAITSNLTIFATGLTPTSALNVSSTDFNGNDAIYGSYSNDTLNGGGGNDTISGGFGADYIDGGAGNDVFLVAAAADHTAADTIIGGTGTDTIRFTSTTANETLTLSANVTDVDNIIFVSIASAAGDATGTTALNATAAALTGALRVNLSGNAGNNVLIGTANADIIDGGAGNDVINGGAGNDTLIGGEGNDTLTGGVGADNMSGGDGDDTFVISSASHLTGDTIDGGAGGTDRIRLDVTGTYNFALASVSNVEQVAVHTNAAMTITLTDNFNTDNGNVEIINTSGSAVTADLTISAVAFVGGTAGLNMTATDFDGDDNITGGTGSDTIRGGGGNDTVQSGGGNDYVYGGAGADSIVAGDGADTVLGEDGDDTILGGAGADSLVGGAGADVIWGGQGADTINTNDGTVDSIIIVGTLPNDATKLADVNATLDALMGYDYPDVDHTYVSDVAVGDTMNMDTTSGVTDLIYTFGAVDLSGMTLTGNYDIVSHSTVTLTESQLNAARSITFIGASTHELIIVDSSRVALDAMDQQAAMEAWADAPGQQLQFIRGNAAGAASGVRVGGDNYTAVAKPNNRLLVDELFEAPVRGASVEAGSPFATSAGVQNLRWDDASNGQLSGFALNGDDFITTPGRTVSKRVEVNDRFAGANFISYFEPGHTQIPIPSTFGSYGDDAVHREQYEVFNGSYDIRTGIFTVQRSPYFGGGVRTEYTLIIYDDDPAVTVGDVEGIVFANQMLERSGWSTISPKTANAKLQFGNTNLDSTTPYHFIYGTSSNDGSLTSTSDIDYIYGLDGNDYIFGGPGDFLFAGTGADTVVSGVGENLIDLGYTLSTWSTGDDAQDIVIIGEGASQAAGANAYGHLTGQDYIYNFEFDLDILRVVKTGLNNFNHTTHTKFGAASMTSGVTANAFSATTLTIDFNNNGNIGAGEVAVTFDQYHGNLSTGRVQYDLVGTSGNDVIVGGDLNDTIRGGSGNDTLTGGAGADNLSGGVGNDLFLFATVTELMEDQAVDGEGDTDTIRIASQVTTAVNLGTQAVITSVEVLELTGGSTAYVTPDSEMTQVVLGSAGMVQMSVTTQAVTGSAGNDKLKIINGVSSSSDLMGGTNTVVVTDGANISGGTFTATGGTVGYDLDLASTTTMTIAQNALITSAGGFNIVTLSNAGTATGFGGVEGYVLADGANTFTMVAGNRTVTGGAGNDIVEGSSGSDSITLGDGDDILIISAATDSVYENYDGGDHVNGDTIRVTGTGNVDLSNDMITGFEKLDLITDTGAQSVTMLISQRMAIGDISGIAQDVVTVIGAFDNSLDYSALSQGDATIILDDNDNRVTIDVTDADNMRTGGAKFASNDTITIAATEDVLASVFATPANYSTTALGGAAILLNDSVDNTITINTNQFVALSTQGIKFTTTEDIILIGAYGTATNWHLFTTTQIGGNSVTLDDNDNLVTIDTSDLTAMNLYGQTFVAADDVTLNTSTTTDISAILWIDNLTAISNNIDLTGNSGDNILTGNVGFNKLDGGAGNDTLIGGVGKDTLLGGDGDDLFIVNGTADVVAGEIYDGGDGNLDKLRLTATTNFTGVHSIINIEIFELAAGVAATFDAATLTGQTITINGTGDNGGESLTVNGTASGDIIDMSRLSIDTNDISGVVINGGDGNDTITGTNGVDTLIGGEGSDVFVYTATNQTTTGSTISQMDVIEGFNITEDRFDLSALGAISGLTVTDDPADADSYVISWTSGSGSGVTNSVYVKDTGVTGGLTLTNTSGQITVTAATEQGLAYTTFTVSSTGVSVGNNAGAPYRAYLHDPDTTPVKGSKEADAGIYTVSTNLGSSSVYTFDTTVVPTGTTGVVEAEMSLINTNTGLTNTHPNTLSIGTSGGDTFTISDADGGIAYGNGGNDSITGGVGNDYIFGGDGNDTIVGGAGNDLLSGGAGADVFRYASGIDGVDTIIDFSTGEDIYETTFITSNTTSSELTLSASNVVTSNGDVGFNFDTGSHELLKYSFDFSADRDSGATLSETVENPLSVFDLLQALEAQLVLDASGAVGAATNGAFSSVTPYSSFFIQITNSGNGNSYLLEAANDADTVLRITEVKLVGIFENANLTAADIVSQDPPYFYSLPSVSSGVADPNDRDDSVNNGFTSGDDIQNGLTITTALYAGAGNDSVSAEVGSQLIYGGSGNDTLDGGNGSDTLYGGSGDDVLRGGPHGNDFYGGYGADEIYFEEQAFNDYGAGNAELAYFLDERDTGDVLYGFGPKSGDKLVFSFDADKNVSGLQTFSISQSNSLRPNEITWFYDQANGRVQLAADTDGDINTAEFVIWIDDQYTTVFSTDQNDTIVGYSGNDLIMGGGGDDLLTGGGGVDTFIFSSSAAFNGKDTIVDFTAGVGGDILDVSMFRIDANFTVSEISSLSIDESNYSVSVIKSGTISVLVDIQGGQDITTKSGLELALATGGEYSNIDMTANTRSVILTSADKTASSNVHVFYASSDSSGNISVEEVALLQNVNPVDLRAENFLI